jgi:histidinol phosphatase-like PHP family hydrolase
MIDLHTHTIFSDGVLVPAELAQRARGLGLSALALTDHVDQSNIGLVVPALAKFCRAMRGLTDLVLVPGMELTHVPPAAIAALAREGRRLGAALVLVHGETMVEPVAPGTNRAAILAGVDILAHPGLIAEEDVALAAVKGVRLEISARKGHSLGNGRVAALARKHGALLVLNTDAHGPEDLIGLDFARAVALGAGLSSADFDAMLANSRALVATALRRLGRRSGGRK